jgi:hypothetical protein
MGKIWQMAKVISESKEKILVAEQNSHFFVIW